MVEEKHCKGCEVLWIAHGFTPIDPENWSNWTLIEEEMVPKFEMSDTGRYIAIKDDGGVKFGIITEVIGKMIARVWHPNIFLKEGGQGISHIIDISKFEFWGDWVGDLSYPSEFVRAVSKARQMRKDQ